MRTSSQREEPCRKAQREPGSLFRIEKIHDLVSVEEISKRKKKIVGLLEFNADKDPTRTDREVIE